VVPRPRPVDYVLLVRESGHGRTHMRLAELARTACDFTVASKDLAGAEPVARKGRR
jgi:hypothetical protein